MPRKGMRSVFFNPSPWRSPTPNSVSSPSNHRRTTSFSDCLILENVQKADSLISKWDSNGLSTLAPLFSPQNSYEAKQFLNSVTELQSAMLHFVAEDPSSQTLIRAHTLMQTAMRRLQLEFHQILKSNQQHLDPESVTSQASRSSASDFDDESKAEAEADDAVLEMERASIAAMADLKSIADCMIASGYGKECVKIYKIVRKSIVDEALYHLGIERLGFSQMQKLDWEVMEIRIKSWLNAVKVAVKTLFYGEKILCDHVFSASKSVRESCFSEIAVEGATSLFAFAENVAKCKKLSPDKVFRTLDLYQAISDLWPEIESIFSFDSTSAVRSQAVNSLIKLSEAVRTMLTNFEAAISKDNSKAAVPGGGVHPLTHYVMNYVTSLADYSGILSDILADWPLAVPSPLPEAYFGSPALAESPEEGATASAISVRFAWLVLMLLCKLDGKAEQYKHVAQSYLFLANNLQHVAKKVRQSNLKFLLGEEWIARQEEKVKQYAANYGRIGWSKVLASLPENQPATAAEMSLPQVRDCFEKFNAAFKEACKTQRSWVVADAKLREDIKISVARKLVPRYRDFYDKYRSVLRRDVRSESFVRFAPDDMKNYLSSLLCGSASSNHSTASFSFAPSAPKRNRTFFFKKLVFLCV